MDAAVNLVGDLRCFVTLAQERHFGRAAGRLHLTQPALSRTIARLERSLGTRLFVRTSRSVELSAAGEVLLADAIELVERTDRFTALAAEAARGEIGTIRAGVPVGLPAAVVATLATALRANLPTVRLDLRELEPAIGLPPELDAALVVPGLAGTDAGVARGPVLVQRLGVLVAADGELGRRRELHFADLGTMPLAILPVDQRTWEAQLLASCRRAGYQPSAIHRPQQHEFALGLVLAGEAVALGDAALAGEPGLTWVPVMGAGPQRALQPAWHAEGDERERGERFADIAVAALSADGAWQRLGDEPPRAPAPRPGSFA
jgi:DNA-binding transcriptional LysR family regulator